MKRLLLLPMVLMILSACSDPVREQQEALIDQQQQVLKGLELRKTPTTPRHLSLPREVEARVVPVVLSDGELIPPMNPRVLGWWGRKAGARHGATLLLGHTVHRAAWKTYGRGALDNLEDIAVGTDVNVSGVHYTVVSNRVMTKTAIARRATRIFSQTGPPRLVVVTCEGYNKATGQYSSNVVMVAKETA